MYPGNLSAEQHRWMEDQLRRGCTPASIVQALMEVGHDADDAGRAVEAAVAAASGRAAPRVVFELARPRIRLLDDGRRSPKVGQGATDGRATARFSASRSVMGRVARGSTLPLPRSGV